MEQENKNTGNLLKWLCRDYKTTERWKDIARKFYLATVSHPDGDGDSEQARKDLAAFFQSFFDEFDPKEKSIDKWSKDFSSIEKINVCPPDSVGGVNWDWLADYFLLAASVSWKEFDEMNEVRLRWNQAYRDRIETNKERLQRHSIFDKKLFDSVIAEGIDVFQYGKIMERIKKAMLDEDKKHWQENKTLQEKIDKRSYTDLQKQLYCNEPIPIREQDKGADKLFLPKISLYQTKYFNTPKVEKDNPRSMDKQEELWTS